MSPILLLSLFVTVVIGVPVAFVLFAGPIAAVYFTGHDIYMTSFLQRVYSGLNQYPILAIPMFLLAGELLNTGRITERLIDFASDCVGHWRGGLAQVNNLSSLMFAGLSGSALADAASLGRILIPEMERKGYSRAFSSAITAAGSLVGPIIPPSIIMIIYAYVMNLSVGALFAAGILPGILMTTGLCVMTNIMARRHGLPREPKRPPLRDILVKGIRVLPALAAPLIVVGGILGGLFTATEASAVAVLYALFLGVFWTRTLTPKVLLRSVERAAMGAGTILLIIGAAAALSWLLTILRIPVAFSSLFLGITDQPQIFVLLVIAMLAIAGMFLDAGPAILIFGPILSPIVAQYGIDPVHFAIVMCLTLTIGLATPPFGMVLFTVVAVGRVSVGKLLRAMWPFLVVHLAILLIIAFVPAISLTIPRLLGF